MVFYWWLLLLFGVSLFYVYLKGVCVELVLWLSCYVMKLIYLW